MTEPLVRRDLHDGIATLVLDSPANRNALSEAMLTQLTEALTDVGADPHVQAIVLRSSGSVFCAGADLKEAATVDMVEQARRIIAVQRAIVAAPQPVVVVLAGPVRAGGLGLVASADLVVCADTVTFALTEVRLGLAAATISIPLLARLQSRPAALWFLSGATFTAQEAHAGGLVTRVVPAAELDAAVDTLLTDLRAGARQGLVAAKALLTAPLLAQFEAHGDELSALSGELFHSPVAQERMATALAARRRPQSSTS